MPQRNNPGKIRKIFGAMAAIGGNDPDEVLYAPYNRKMRDWKAKYEPLAKGAELERLGNVNERTLANSVVTQEMGDRRLDRQSRRDRDLFDQGNRRLTDTEDRNAVLKTNAEESGRRADARLKVSQAVAKGGTVNIDDAGNGRIVYKDGSTEPFEGKYLSAEEKASLKKQYSTTNPQRDRIRTEVIDDAETGKRIAVTINLDTNEVTPVKIKRGDGTQETVTPVVKESSNTEAMGASKNIIARANKVKADHPEWASYITFDKKTGAPTIKPRGFGGLTGPDPATHTKIRDAIFGGKIEQKIGDKSASETNKTTIKPPRTGMIKIRNKTTGKSGDFPKGSPIPNGFEEVK